MTTEKLNELLLDDLTTGTAGVALVNVEALSLHGKVRPVMKAGQCITLSCSSYDCALEYTIYLSSLEEAQKIWREAKGFKITKENLNRIIIRGIKWMEVVTK